MFVQFALTSSTEGYKQRDLSFTINNVTLDKLLEGSNTRTMF